jgi:isochorismatase family protein
MSDVCSRPPRARLPSRCPGRAASPFATSRVAPLATQGTSTLQHIRMTIIAQHVLNRDWAAIRSPASRVHLAPNADPKADGRDPRWTTKRAVGSLGFPAGYGARSGRPPRRPRGREINNLEIQRCPVPFVRGIPVVLTSSQEQNIQGPLLPELEGILPEAFAARVKRAGIVNAWNDPNFKAAVEKTQRRNLIMAGVTTDVCLVYPAISACREGYQVQAVLDASGSPYDISEEMSRRRMEREGVVLTATNTLMAELAQDWSRPEGGQLLGILFQEVLPSIA